MDFHHVNTINDTEEAALFTSLLTVTGNKSWASYPPYSTVSRTRTRGWTAALCRGYQPHSSTWLKAAGKSQSSCSASMSPAGRRCAASAHDGWLLSLSHTSGRRSCSFLFSSSVDVNTAAISTRVWLLTLFNGLHKLHSFTAECTNRKMEVHFRKTKH